VAVTVAEDDQAAEAEEEARGEEEDAEAAEREEEHSTNEAEAEAGRTLLVVRLLVSGICRRAASSVAFTSFMSSDWCCRAHSTEKRSRVGEEQRREYTGEEPTQKRERRLKTEGRSRGRSNTQELACVHEKHHQQLTFIMERWVAKMLCMAMISLTLSFAEPLATRRTEREREGV
jgi:hypothetical protein